MASGIRSHGAASVMRYSAHLVMAPRGSRVLRDYPSTAQSIRVAHPPTSAAATESRCETGTTIASSHCWRRSRDSFVREYPPGIRSRAGQTAARNVCLGEAAAILHLRAKCRKVSTPSPPRPQQVVRKHQEKSRSRASYGSDELLGLIPRFRWNRCGLPEI